MCGIIGVFNNKDCNKLVDKGIRILKNRGKDGSGEICSENNCIGHTLHAVVGHVKQPIKNKGTISANCEIYNWKELNKKYCLDAKNDADLLVKLIDKKGINKISEILDELDGDYAFAYWYDDKVVVARDIVGVKPVFYSFDKGFAFASEGKVLEKLGFNDIEELNPRKVIVYDIKDDKSKIIEREFFKIDGCIDKPIEDIKKNVLGLLVRAVEKRIPETKFGIMFSGGIDSTVLAMICKNLGKDFVCYTTALEEEGMGRAEDLEYAKKAASEFGFELKVIKINMDDAERYLKKVIPLIEDTNVVKAGVALTFFPLCMEAKKDSVKVILSGLGSEEIFAGYQRHKRALDINNECLHGLMKLWERDLYRDDVVTMNNSIELRVPFLDKELIEYCLKIPEKYKIKKGIEKYVLRLVAEELKLGEIAWRKKKAAQYGSKTDRAIAKLAKKKGMKLKSEYLGKFYDKKNLKLGALVSGGKDSIYAMFVMKRQNYDIKCMITIKSKNPESYMFHTPAIDIVDMQAEAMNIPLIVQETEGRKEDELKDLEKAIVKAKEKHKIEGIITGALYSTYQRDRIEKICDKLGIKIFSPLWHINQETEMREIINNNFEVILTAVAAEGLNKGWLNKRLRHEDIDHLVKLNKNIGINVAFEGGEAESLVLDCPLFRKRIKIVKSRIVEEDERTAKMIVEEAELEIKNFC